MASVSGKLFIAIDEYDSLTNANAMALYYKDEPEEQNEYLYILKKGGFFRGFLEVIKQGTATAVDQVYITGILPITIADMNSGFNIAEGLFYSGILTFGEFADGLRMPNLITYEFVLNYFNRIMNFDAGTILLERLYRHTQKKGMRRACSISFFKLSYRNTRVIFFKIQMKAFSMGTCSMFYGTVYIRTPMRSCLSTS